MMKGIPFFCRMLARVNETGPAPTMAIVVELKDGIFDAGVVVQVAFDLGR